MLDAGFTDFRSYLVRAPSRWLPLCFFCFVMPSCYGQVRFASCISLALENSARVRAAQLDVKKAQNAMAAAKDIFIPSVVVGGGLGWTYGITLTVPTIFTISAQSLVYSNQQRFAIRAAREDLQAAELALKEARQETEEDAAVTYISLDENQRAMTTLAEQSEFAKKLVSILADRVTAGVDQELDLKKAQRGAVQIELQQMQAEDDRATLVAHLADLTGLSAQAITTVSSSVPEIPIPVDIAEPPPASSGFVSPGILSAEANARAKLDRAKGDAGYTWRPIITFFGQYGRISPINNVSSFYNLQNNYNTADIGVQLSLPVIDLVRRAAARESAVDAARAALDANGQLAQAASSRVKVERSIRELEAKAELAELDLGIAQDELKSTTILQHASSGSPPLTPKEEENAKVQERQKYLDLLDAQLQLSKARIALLRQAGELDGWLHSVVTGAHR